jgi:hypothetical protein
VRRKPLSVRLQEALPILSVYFGLAALYAWQASAHPVPTLYTDEIELTQLSRSIAETGEAARRGEPYGTPTLVAYFLAPVWWLGSVTTSYTAAKLLLVLAMTAVIFPAYLLARLVVPKWYALAAASVAAAVPALAYSPVLVEEPLAYPLATLCLWLIARAYVEPTWMRIATAAVVSAAATLTRTQLSVLFAVFALGFLWYGWQSERIARWRAQWTHWDWLGAVVLAIGIAVAASAFVGHLSQSWRESTGFYKDRVFEHASWAAGALAIGIGILPVIAGLAALARPRDEPRDPKTRAFVVTSVASIVVFLTYAGIKGAFISTRFSTLVVERNLIYLCPVLFAATALAVHRGMGRTWAIAAATAFTAWVVAAVPLRLGEFPYYEAHGLSIAALANRKLSWPEVRIENALLLVCLVSFAAVLALKFVSRRSTAFAALAGTIAVAVLAWNLTTEVYAAEGERILSQRIAGNLTEPYDWVDRETRGKSVVVVGQQIADPTGIWLTEFFNPSVKKVWSLDGSAPGPGAILTPDLAAVDGTLTPPPGTDYAVTVNGVELQAPVVDQRNGAILYRLDGKPLTLAFGYTGLYSDGWMADRASYTRYDTSRDGPGLARVILSRERWCPHDKPGRATVKIGTVGIGEDNQPTIGRVTGTWTEVIHACQTYGHTFQPPRGPWRVEVTIEPTFAPRELDPSRSDNRQLGAVFETKFVPLFGSDSSP